MGANITRLMPTTCAMGCAQRSAQGPELAHPGCLCDNHQMADEPENLVQHYLRSLDSRVNRVINDIGEVKTRLTSIETRITSLEASGVQVHERLDGMQQQLDNVGNRLDRIERRLDLTGADARPPV